MKKRSQKWFLMGNFHSTRSVGKPRKKMEGYSPEGCITDSRSAKLEETSWE
jgi:hypothetical protein